MTDIEKIKKFIAKKHSINCALTDEIMEFIAKVESESKDDVAKPLLAEVQAFLAEVSGGCENCYEEGNKLLKKINENFK